MHYVLRVLTRHTQISLMDAARRASASGHPGLNQIRALISCNQTLLIQVKTRLPRTCQSPKI